MRTAKVLLLIMLGFVAFAACANLEAEPHKASLEEVLLVIKNQMDYKSVKELIDVRSRGQAALREGLAPAAAWFPSFDQEPDKPCYKEGDKVAKFAYIVIYKTVIPGKEKMVFLSDDHPPEILWTIKLGEDTVQKCRQSVKNGEIPQAEICLACDKAKGLKKTPPPVLNYLPNGIIN